MRGKRGERNRYNEHNISALEKASVAHASNAMHKDSRWNQEKGKSKIKRKCDKKSSRIQRPAKCINGTCDDGTNGGIAEKGEGENAEAIVGLRSHQGPLSSQLTCSGEALAPRS